jgi:hypothetical protein
MPQMCGGEIVSGEYKGHIFMEDFIKPAISEFPARTSIFCSSLFRKKADRL